MDRAKVSGTLDEGSIPPRSTMQKRQTLDRIIYGRRMRCQRRMYASADGRKEEVILINPKETFKEDVDHYLSYKKTTFCTFFTKIKFWDTESEYARQGRKAAERLKEFIRVFMIDNRKDLNKSSLLSQIELDLKAGIQVYLCWYRDVVKEVPEPDFGTWDNKFLCIVCNDKQGEIKYIKMSNRREEIKKALRWKKIIMAKAKKVISINDVKNYD